jgi:hypothetical protein
MNFVGKLINYPLNGGNIKKLFWGSYKYLFFNVVDFFFQKRIFKLEKDAWALLTFKHLSVDLPELQDLENQPI